MIPLALRHTPALRGPARRAARRPPASLAGAWGIRLNSQALAAGTGLETGWVSLRADGWSHAFGWTLLRRCPLYPAYGALTGCLRRISGGYSAVQMRAFDKRGIQIGVA